MKWPKQEKCVGPSDYWHIGPVYIRKWLVLMAIGTVSLLVLGVFGLPTALLKPFSDAPPVYRYDDPVLQSLSGVVQIEDDAGCIRYIGDVEQGAYTGNGKVYDSRGCLCYDGPLVDGVYEGENAKVYADGILIYSGAMAANLYEGDGCRINPDTGVKSEGQFAEGMLEGEGKEYRADGVLLREGTFSQDLLNGEGKEYAQNGSLLYEGTFQRGLYHGSGKLYNVSTQTLCYEGDFVEGKPVGVGKIYHSSGQLLYEGMVYDANPRADAFLGLSLAEVEQAFTQHWQIYVWENTIAFVYPYFHLMFISESPVRFASPAEEETQAEQERQELLEALQPSAKTGANPVESAAKTASREPQEETDAGDETLSSECDHTAILITQVLSYGAELPGIAQTEDGQPLPTTALGWPEWFSDYAGGSKPQGALVQQTGPFVYRFTATKYDAAAAFEKSWAVNDTLETVTAWKTDKSQTLWYQTAKWRKEA